MTHEPRQSGPEQEIPAYFARAQELFGDRFDIERFVAASQDRVLFLCRDRLLKRRIALRVHLKPDTRSREWFEREVQLLARLNHPSVRTVFSAGYAGDWAYRVSEWIEGESLEDAMRRGPRPIPMVLRLARDLAEVIEYCHSQDAIVRRILPTTVMLDNQKRAIITDLRFANEVLEVAGEDQDSTLPFLAPEVRGNHSGDPAGDIYAIGAVLYYAVTGEPPSIDPATVVPPSDLRAACPAFVERVIMRALSVEPMRRYLTGAELVQEITAAVGEFDFHTPEAPMVGAKDDGKDWERRLRRALGDDYELLDLLGAGGFGRVYRVRDLRLEREVALKVVHSHLAADASIAERFQREAQLAARLAHPNIVNIYDINRRFGFIWYTMVYVKGLNLANLVNISGPQPADMVIQMLRQALGALQHAHNHGVVHRDLKPENILMSEVDGSIQIADFGLALALESSGLAGTSSRSGTPEFAAPEQLLGETVDPRTDLYSLALVAMFALLGRSPFTGSAEAILAQKSAGIMPDLAADRSDVPPGLVAALLRAASRDQAERFEDAEDFRNALQSIRRASDRARQPWYRRLFPR